MENKNIIEVNNLIKNCKKAKEVPVDKISFSVEKGSFFSLLGPNGAGKTTTLSILNTTLNKSGGSIKIAGLDIEKDATNVRSKIGVIFQNPSLDLNLTAEENIRFHANIYGLYSYKPFFSMMPKEYKSKVKELTSVLGLTDKDLAKPVKSLSGGMKRKLEIIRSLMHTPEILFLDEPTTGLDPLSRKSLWEYLKNIREKENITMFLTTHYLEEAEQSDYVAIINKGKIVSEGTPKQIKEKLIKKYILLNSPNPQTLEKELKDKSINYIKEVDIKVYFENDLEASKIIKSLNSEIIKLDIHNPTLEEAYIDIIENNKVNKTNE